MDSEPGFIWALVQSLSLENADIFRGQRFGINLPLNLDSRSRFDEGLFESLLQMQSLADHSTHLRATCHCPTRGLKKQITRRAPS
ncbi:unnamed protein product [Porites lobata]|uniref:Uncharacterized protein n=1 Tax=Porites lobata TaxID=104759 RepID=A0ABN8RYU3_9CNID|nr:unnamed protein product [Porites lobata]